MFELKKYQPKIFAEYIDCYKVYNFGEAKQVKLDPEGHFELIFQFDHEFLHDTSSTNGWELRPQNFIGGLHTQSYSIQPKSANAKVFGIQFKAIGAKHFIPDKLQVYKNKIIHLNDALPGLKATDFSAFSASDMPLKGIERLEKILLKFFREKKYSAIDKAVDIITNRHGFVNINELANEVNLSSAQFRKRFNEEVGMSPKEYCKIIRFTAVRQKLQQDPQIKLTDLSYQLGYFDQAHFIKDFQSITGLSPKHYRRV